MLEPHDPPALPGPAAPAQPDAVVGGAPGILAWKRRGGTTTLEQIGDELYEEPPPRPSDATAVSSGPAAATDHSPAAASTDTSWLADASSMAADTPSAPAAFYHPGGRRPTMERSFRDLDAMRPRAAAAAPRPFGDDASLTPSPRDSSEVDRLVVDPMKAAMADAAPELVVRSLSPEPVAPFVPRRPPPVDVSSRSPDEKTPPAPGASQSSAHYSTVLAQAVQPAASPAAAPVPAKTNPAAGSGGPGLS